MGRCAIVLGVLRILKGWPIHWFIIGGYLLVVAVTMVAPESIIGIAYDSGGVTTSTMTVPLVTALGVGLASSIKGRNPMLDGFGLIMFASYPANNLDFVDFPIPILTIIGSKDPGSPEQEAFYQDISPSARLFMIEGGNHRQYADYSFQKDDGIATISALEQQQQIIFATTEFLGSLK